MIGIIDYGMGNLHSVSNALRRLEYPHIISDNIEELNDASGLILPGVGAFPDAMTILNENELTPFLKRYVETKPLLGICLGMQLLFEESEEHGMTQGLGLLPGRVVPFPGVTSDGERYKVPHMGWNQLNFHQVSPFTKGLDQDYAYFVHSFYVETDPEVIVASSDYHVQVPGIVQQGKIFGTQFHPEKSSHFGMGLLRNFGQFVEGKVEKA